MEISISLSARTIPTCYQFLPLAHCCLLGVQLFPQAAKIITDHLGSSLGVIRILMVMSHIRFKLGGCEKLQRL